MKLYILKFKKLKFSFNSRVLIRFGSLLNPFWRKRVLLPCVDSTVLWQARMPHLIPRWRVLKAGEFLFHTVCSGDRLRGCYVYIIQGYSLQRVKLLFSTFFRIRLAFEAIFKKSATLQDVNPDPESGRQSALEIESEPMLAPTSPRASKKVQLVNIQARDKLK